MMLTKLMKMILGRKMMKILKKILRLVNSTIQIDIPIKQCVVNGNHTDFANVIDQLGTIVVKSQNILAFWRTVVRKVRTCQS